MHEQSDGAATTDAPGESAGVTLVVESVCLGETLSAQAVAQGVPVVDDVRIDAPASSDDERGSTSLGDRLVRWNRDDGVDAVLAWLHSKLATERLVAAVGGRDLDVPVVACPPSGTAGEKTAGLEDARSPITPQQIQHAALERAGVLPVETVEALLDAGAVLAGSPSLAGDGVAVVSNAGGPGVMAIDAVGSSRLTPASFGEETQAALDALLPAGGNADNPVDVLADASLDRYGEVLDLVLGDDAVAGAVVISAPSRLFDFADLARTITERVLAHGKPVAGALMGGETTAPAAAVLRRAGVPNYFDPMRAVESLETLYRVRELNARPTDAPTTRPDGYRGERDECGRVLAVVAGDGPTTGDAPVQRLCEAVGVGWRADGRDADRRTDEETEVVVSGTRSAGFGPVVGVGLGGDFEVLGGHQVGPAPVARETAVGMLSALDGAAVLEGTRGREGVDLDALADAVSRFSWLLADQPRLGEFRVELAAGATAVAVTSVDARTAGDEGDA